MTSLVAGITLRITPDPDDLIPYKKVKCGICGQNFLNAGNLHMHLARHHKYLNCGKGRRLQAFPKSTYENNYRKLYFCPIRDCIYNEKVLNGGRHFTNMKYIRQHFQKVHIKKTFQCEKCDKAFSTIGAKSAHEGICGKMFKCAVCDNNYTTREALLTHTRRKKHHPVENNNLENSNRNEGKIAIPNYKHKITKESTNTENDGSRIDKNILEIKISPIQYFYIVKTPTESKDQQCQTEMDSIQGTQYSIHKDRIGENTTVALKSNDFQSYYDDSCFNQLVNDSNLCDIETQTELPTEFDQLLNYANTHTQTCEDFLQELCLTDIQTQTHWSMSNNNEIKPNETNINNYLDEKKVEIVVPNTVSGADDELLVSTETQTSFTQCLLECENMTSYITQCTQTDQWMLNGLF